MRALVINLQQANSRDFQHEDVKKEHLSSGWLLAPGFYISSSRTTVGVRSISRVSQSIAKAKTYLVI